MHEIFRIKKWLGYQWLAKTKYYLHSPFVYRFYLNVLEGAMDDNVAAIEALRRELRNNNTQVLLVEHGTGINAQQKISNLESTVAIRPKYGQVLYQLVKYFNPSVILELGTSIGLSSAYLALGSNTAKVITIEGSASLIQVAKSNYTKLNIANVETVCGNFDTCLTGVLYKTNVVSMVFFDGNHRKEATLEYFKQCLTKANENSIFIFDDIYWSADMNEAWEEIKRHPKIKLTIDIYQLGICFFIQEKLAKEDFMLRY